MTEQVSEFAMLIPLVLLGVEHVYDISTFARSRIERWRMAVLNYLHLCLVHASPLALEVNF
jgi:hypothetical protein